MKGLAVVEVHQLAPDALAEAQAAISGLLRLETQRATMRRQTAACELDTAKLLLTLSENGWFRAATGQPRAQWLVEHLTNSDGDPMSEDAADSLIRDYRAISRFPVVEHVLREGDKQAFSRTACFYACATALDGKWLEREVAGYLEGKKPLTDKVIQDAQQHAIEAVNLRILELLGRRSSLELRDDYYAQRLELRRANGEQIIEWTKIKGHVPKTVKEQADMALVRVGRLSGDELNPDKMTLTQWVERFGVFAEDVCDALDQINQGNDGPLRSLVEQSKKARGEA